MESFVDLFGATQPWQIGGLSSCSHLEPMSESHCAAMAVNNGIAQSLTALSMPSGLRKVNNETLLCLFRWGDQGVEWRTT